MCRRDERETHTTENASSTRMNFPPPLQGERTCPRSPPVLPSANASVYAGSVMAMSAAPRISTKQMGMNSPKNVKRNTRTLEESAGSRQL